LDSAATSSEPTPEPSKDADVAPPLPPEARGSSKAAAVAFVEHWIATFNHAVASGSTVSLRPLSQGCAACDAIVGLIDEVHSKQGRIRTRGWSVRTIEALDTAPIIQVRTLVKSAPQAFLVPGEPSERFAGGESVKTFTLKRASNRWCVTHLDQS
jgi:hypothetical protein